MYWSIMLFLCNYWIWYSAVFSVAFLWQLTFLIHNYELDRVKSCDSFLGLTSGNLAFFFLFCFTCVRTKYVLSQVFPTRMECSLSIRQQKHKMKEIPFCSSNVWEKHLEESGRERGRNGGRYRGGRAQRRQRVRERWFISPQLYGFFFFFLFRSLSFARPAEMDHRSAQSAELNFKVNGNLSDGHWRTFFVKKKNNKCDVLMSAEVLSGRHIDSSVWIRTLAWRAVCVRVCVCVCVCVYSIQECVLSKNVLMNAPDTTRSKNSIRLFIVIWYLLPEETRVDFTNRRSEKLWLRLQLWWRKNWDALLRVAIIAVFRISSNNMSNRHAENYHLTEQLPEALLSLWRVSAHCFAVWMQLYCLALL